MSLLEIQGLSTVFQSDGGIVRAVDGIDLAIHAGETLGLVGESGCGKSMTALSILRLVPEPAGRIERGRIFFRGQDLLALDERGMQHVRGNSIAMVFQEPLSALNPVLTVGSQIAEVLELHRGLDRRRAREQTHVLLELVGIPDPVARARSHPHQLSGGMRQRVMLAMAVACDPALLLADEPTTALDVTVQAQILALLSDLKQRKGMSVLLITHDLGVVAELADRVAVMYAGKIVEVAPVLELFERPAHPYSIGLLRSRPSLERASDRLRAIPGVVPNPLELPSGCRFRTRCPIARDSCALEEPPLAPVEGSADHLAACPFGAEARDDSQATST